MREERADRLSEEKMSLCRYASSGGEEDRAKVHALLVCLLSLCVGGWM